MHKATPVISGCSLSDTPSHCVEPASSFAIPTALVGWASSDCGQCVVCIERVAGPVGALAEPLPLRARLTAPTDPLDQGRSLRPPAPRTVSKARLRNVGGGSIWPAQLMIGSQMNAAGGLRSATSAATTSARSDAYAVAASMVFPGIPEAITAANGELSRAIFPFGRAAAQRRPHSRPDRRPRTSWDRRRPENRGLWSPRRGAQPAAVHTPARV
jgi:hypothetical protein